MLKNKHVDLRGKNSLILGKGRLSGNPLASFLANEGHTFHEADVNTPVENLKQMVREADIIFSATGQQDIVE
jgi:5,10-methylene-tetrahydrofolate dehydrogenase/methenyl tetrahydrofolate cyclohydrolase